MKRQFVEAGEYSWHLHQFYFGNKEVRLKVPDPVEVREKYESQLKFTPAVPFPFWTKVWPSSKALAAFIEEYSHLVLGKTVLEIGAGLSLPSLLAATYAKKVICTDYLPEVLNAMQLSVDANKLENVECRLLDWRCPSIEMEGEILLASDINYDPMQFEEVYLLLKNAVGRGKTILLATPERLQSRLFVEKLQGWIRYSKNYSFEEKNTSVVISVFVLREEEND